MFLALTGAQGVTLSVCPWGTSLSRVHNLHPACTIDRNFYRNAILDALLLLLLREQTTAFGCTISNYGAILGANLGAILGAIGPVEPGCVRHIM